MKTLILILLNNDGLALFKFLVVTTFTTFVTLLVNTENGIFSQDYGLF